MYIPRTYACIFRNGTAWTAWHWWALERPVHAPLPRYKWHCDYKPMYLAQVIWFAANMTSIILFIKRLRVVALSSPCMPSECTRASLLRKGFGSRLLVHFVSLQLWRFVQYTDSVRLRVSIPNTTAPHTRVALNYQREIYSR